MGGVKSILMLLSRCCCSASNRVSEKYKRASTASDEQRSLSVVMRFRIKWREKEANPVGRGVFVGPHVSTFVQPTLHIPRKESGVFLLGRDGKRRGVAQIWFEPGRRDSAASEE